jgi:hypothetical protein
MNTLSFDPTSARWIKSTRSNGGSGNCTEVAVAGDLVAVRDSKDPGPYLVFPREVWQRFVDGLKPV